MSVGAPGASERLVRAAANASLARSKWTMRCAMVLLHADVDVSSKLRGGEKNSHPWHKAIVLASLVVDSILFTAIGVIGAIYFGHTGRGTCHFPVPLFLVIGGFPNLLFTICRAPWLHRESITFAQGVYNVGLLVYGLAIIWPQFPLWTPEDDRNQHYCARMPYISALLFISLLTAWVAVLLLAAFIFCALEVVCGFKEPEEDDVHFHVVTTHGGGGKDIKVQAQGI